MPKLLILAPCERAIISQAENNPTLVNIMNTVGGELELQAGTPPDAPVAVPYTWVIFTLWQMLPNDEGKKLEQQFRIVSPSGKVGLQGETSIEFVGDSSEGTTHRVLSNIWSFRKWRGQLGPAARATRRVSGLLAGLAPRTAVT